DVLNKPTILTEFCCGMSSSGASFDSIAEKYAIEICEDLNNYCIGICDWNLLLNKFGGPFHNRTAASTVGSASKASNDPMEGGCAAPILYDEDNDKIILTPAYYYMGHFSKYIKRGANRLATTKYYSKVYATDFENPEGSIAVVIVNTNDLDEKVAIRYRGKSTKIVLGPHSIATILI
ncbi:MAG: glycoside hydrolase family 30 protein, partial [Clostridia bacterium]|nr:glycoside hydrolase family 30 protein [Clostridia bacterium]